MFLEAGNFLATGTNLTPDCMRPTSVGGRELAGRGTIDLGDRWPIWHLTGEAGDWEALNQGVKWPDTERRRRENAGADSLRPEEG